MRIWGHNLHLELIDIMICLLQALYWLEYITCSFDHRVVQVRLDDMQSICGLQMTCAQ